MGNVTGENKAPAKKVCSGRILAIVLNSEERIFHIRKGMRSLSLSSCMLHPPPPPTQAWFFNE